jgi:hypothetical protein
MGNGGVNIANALRQFEYDYKKYLRHCSTPNWVGGEFARPTIGTPKGFQALATSHIRGTQHG